MRWYLIGFDLHFSGEGQWAPFHAPAAKGHALNHICSAPFAMSYNIFTCPGDQDTGIFWGHYTPITKNKSSRSLLRSRRPDVTWATSPHLFSYHSSPCSLHSSFLCAVPWGARHTPAFVLAVPSAWIVLPQTPPSQPHPLHICPDLSLSRRPTY